VLITGTPTVTIVTHNIPPSLSLANGEAAIATVTQGADIVAGQEWSKWRDIVAGLTSFDSWYPPQAAPGSIPILWRKKTFRLRGQGSNRVYEDGLAVEAGAGPEPAHAGWTNNVCLEHIETGLVLGVVNCHPIPSIQAGPLRAALHERTVVHVAAVVGPALALFGATTMLALADWNSEPDSTAMQALGWYGWKCDTLGTPTLAGRSVDDVFRRGGDLEPVAQRTIKTASDHDAAAVDYRITA
jgi:hypothetical protein